MNKKITRIRPGPMITVPASNDEPVEPAYLMGEANHIVLVRGTIVTVSVYTKVSRANARRWRAIGLTVLEVLDETPRHWSVRWFYQLREWANRRHA